MNLVASTIVIGLGADVLKLVVPVIDTNSPFLRTLVAAIVTVTLLLNPSPTIFEMAMICDGF